MATSEESNASMGFLFGVVLLIIFAIVFAYMLIPTLRGTATPGTSSPETSAPTEENLVVPEEIDINVNDGANGDTAQ
jgi:flagellar basal body-associated protein FliL